MISSGFYVTATALQLAIIPGGSLCAVIEVIASLGITCSDLMLWIASVK
jgi:hypothetical protein